MQISSGLLDERSPGPRIGGPVITPQDIGTLWPEVSRRLSSQLRRRGVSATDCEDLVQECALRLLRNPLPCQDAEDLLRWCNTVTHNLHVDLLRRRTADPLDEHADVQASTDVHQEVAARLLLSEVGRAWRKLSPRDRDVLGRAGEGVIATHADRRDAVRENVARHRARARLTAMLAGALSLAGAALSGLRRSVCVTAPALALSVLFAVVIPGAASPSSPALPTARGEVTTIVQAPSAVLEATKGPAAAPGRDARPHLRRWARQDRGVHAGGPILVLPTGESAGVRHREGTTSGVSICARGLPAAQEVCLTVDATVLTDLPR
jgi:hypothetical protein